MSFQQKPQQQEANNYEFSNAVGLDVFGSKKSKGIIYRMKRSLSASGRPPQPLKLSSSNYNNDNSAINSPNSTNSSNETQHSFSPIPSTLSSPTPTSARSQLSGHFGPSPTTHLSYETFSSSASNLSIRSFPVRINNKDEYGAKPSSTLAIQEKLQVKSMFESRFITAHENLSMKKLVNVTNSNDTKTTKMRYAPAPAMYWSCPQVFGVKPPKLRAHASVVYGDRMFVYGGTSKSICSDTLYILELETLTWSTPRVYGKIPPSCRAHCLSVNPENGKLYLFGGGDGQKYHNHLYVLDTHTMIWSRPKTSGNPPSERRAHVTVFWKNAIYVFGGGDGTKALNDTYRLDVKTKVWSTIHAQGTKPDPRGYHTGTLIGSKLVVFGGSDGKECFGGIHVLDLEKNVWSNIELDKQVPRLSHSAICIGSFLFVIAGHDGAQYRNNLYMLNLVNMTWETKTIYGQAPSPRGYHTTVLHDSRIVLFGGYNGSSFSNDVYILDLSSYAYLPQIVNFSIDAFLE